MKQSKQVKDLLKAIESCANAKPLPKVLPLTRKEAMTMLIAYRDVNKHEILLKGFRGYKNYSKKELKKEIYEVFGNHQKIKIK